MPCNETVEKNFFVCVSFHDGLVEFGLLFCQNLKKTSVIFLLLYLKVNGNLLFCRVDTRKVRYTQRKQAFFFLAPLFFFVTKNCTQLRKKKKNTNAIVFGVLFL